MKDYEPERQPSIEISTQASADQHWQALDRSVLAPRSVLLYAERLSEAVDLRPMLSTGQIMAVQVAGDPAADGAVLDFAFVQGLRKQCIAAEVPFHFAGTGANFQMKGRVFHIRGDVRERRTGGEDRHGVRGDAKAAAKRRRQKVHTDGMGSDGTCAVDV